MTESFGNRLKTLRKKAGLTQPELAYLIGVHETTIRRWENDNKSTPSIEEVKKLALALHVSESDLINDRSTQPSGWVLNIRISPSLEQEVIDLSKGVPRIATITTSKDGGLLTLGGSYENWTDDNCFKKTHRRFEKIPQCRHSEWYRFRRYQRTKGFAMKNYRFLDTVITFAFSVSFFWLFILEPLPASICFAAMWGASIRKKKRINKFSGSH